MTAIDPSVTQTPVPGLITQPCNLPQYVLGTNPQLTPLLTACCHAVCSRVPIRDDNKLTSRLNCEDLN